MMYGLQRTDRSAQMLVMLAVPRKASTRMSLDHPSTHTVSFAGSYSTCALRGWVPDLPVTAANYSQPVSTGTTSRTATVTSHHMPQRSYSHQFKP